MCVYMYNTTSGAGGASRGPWLARIDRRAASSLACEWGRKRVVRIQLGSAEWGRGGGGAGSIDHRPFRWNNSNANASRRHRGEGRKSPLARRWSSDHGVKLARASRVISIFQNSFLPLYPPLSARANSIRGGDFSYFRSLIFSCNCKGRSKCYVSKVDIE